MPNKITIIFKSKEDYIKSLEEIIKRSLQEDLTIEIIDDIIFRYTDLEKPILGPVLEEPNEVIRNLPVIEKMNEILAKGGRSGMGWSNEQKQFATTYFLKILNRQAYSTTKKEWVILPGDKISNEILIEQGLCAFLDFTEGGHDFLTYYNEQNIPSNLKKEIATKLIELTEKTIFRTYNTSDRILIVLGSPYYNRELPELWRYMESHSEVGSKPPFNSAFVNGILKPKVIAYAKKTFL